MKILLDEMWVPAIAQQFRLRGFDVIAVVERTELRSLSDEALFAMAQREQRAFMTDNARDLRLIAASYHDASHAGLILTDKTANQPARSSIGPIVTALSRLIEDDPDLTNREHWSEPHFPNQAHSQPAASA